MAAKTNSRQAVSVVVSSVANPEKDVCASGGCSHDGSHHGTSGTCRFSTSCGCKGFVPREN